MEYTVNDDEKAVLDTIRANEAAMIDNRWQMVKVAVTSAEILALNSTPKELVAAPGAGYFLELGPVIMALDYGTAAYVTNGDLSVGDGVAARSDTIALADFLGLSADSRNSVQPLGDVAMTPNAALELNCATGDPATGDGELMLKVFYRVHADAEMGL